MSWTYKTMFLQLWGVHLVLHFTAHLPDETIVGDTGQVELNNQHISTNEGTDIHRKVPVSPPSANPGAQFARRNIP